MTLLPIQRFFKARPIQGIAEILYKNTDKTDARQSRSYRKICTAANARTR
jgi:hypothetical protein